MVEPINLRPVEPGRAAPVQPQARQPAMKTGFAEALGQALGTSEPVRFSAHARQRLEERGVALDDPACARLAEAVDAAAAKGARDGLFLMDELAMVVNVPNRTVVTVVPQDEAGHKVFTNIDSAVIVPAEDGAGAAESATKPIGLDPFRGGLRAAD